MYHLLYQSSYVHNVNLIIIFILGTNYNNVVAFVYDNIVTRFPWDQRTNPFIATVKVALIWLIDTDIMVAFTSRHL